MVFSKKTHSQKMKKKSDISYNDEGRKIFINVNLMDSTGPIRFFVDRNQTVESVIVTSVETFARHGRLQVLGCRPHQFDLYCLTDSGWQVLEPSEVIGSEGRWIFKLCKKPSITTTNYIDTTTANKSGLMKKSDDEEGGRKMLINVNVEGSSLPPIRFYVSQSQTVGSVIETALQTLDRLGHCLLGYKPYQFFLYCSTNLGWQVLESSEAIGLEGRWNFRLCKKPSATANCTTATKSRSQSDLMNLFKSWFYFIV